MPFERKKTEDAGDIMLVVAVVVGAASLLFKVRLGNRTGAEGRAAMHLAFDQKQFSCQARARPQLFEGGEVAAVACYVAGSRAIDTSRQRLRTSCLTQRQEQRRQLSSRAGDSNDSNVRAHAACSRLAMWL